MFGLKKTSKVPSLKLRVAALLAYLVMLVLNALATLLPINGKTSGEISDSYPNLFAPAGMTFAIWGVIYIALGIFAAWLLLSYGKKQTVKVKPAALESVTKLFIYSSLLNALWILCWHYRLIGIALIVITGMLILTGMICMKLHRENLNAKDYSLLKLPFVIYFGWLSVATIANFVTLLVSVGMDGTQGIGVVVAACGILAGGAVGTYVTLKYSDVAYSLVLVWAYYGIVAKHLSVSGWNSEYSGIIIITCAMIGILVAAIGLASRNLLIRRT